MFPDGTETWGGVWISPKFLTPLLLRVTPRTVTRAAACSILASANIWRTQCWRGWRRNRYKLPGPGGSKRNPVPNIVAYDFGFHSNIVTPICRLYKLTLSEQSQVTLQLILDPWIWDRYFVPKRREGITTTRCVIAQKSAVLSLSDFVQIFLFGLPMVGGGVGTNQLSAVLSKLHTITQKPAEIFNSWHVHCTYSKIYLV